MTNSMIFNELVNNNRAFPYLSFASPKERNKEKEPTKTNPKSLFYPQKPHASVPRNLWFALFVDSHRTEGISLSAEVNYETARGNDGKRCRVACVEQFCRLVPIAIGILFLFDQAKRKITKEDFVNGSEIYHT